PPAERRGGGPAARRRLPRCAGRARAGPRPPRARPRARSCGRRHAGHAPSAQRARSTMSPRRPLLLGLPLAALIVVAAFALRRLDDFDTWWHLASRRWIAQHHAIPYTDVLSYTVPTNEWINLQWLYDLLLYEIYSL